MYVLMNKYNHAFYKEHYALSFHIWTIDINDAKQFGCAHEVITYMNTEHLSEDVLIVQI